MLRGLRKAAQSLERNLETAFSTTPPTHTAFLDEKLSFPSHTVRLGPVFAEGGFSFIHAATVQPPSSASTRLAVKRIALADRDARRAADREIRLLHALPPHRNVVRFHGSLRLRGHAFLLLELVDGGALHDFLVAPGRAPLAPARRLAILADAVAAVAHLHAQHPPVAARDVKLENLLYDRHTGVFKLCDFGSADAFAGRHASRRAILEAEEDVAASCTPMYRAPELADLYSRQFVCERVDVWALGCVWYALLFGALPFDGASALQITKGLGPLPSEPAYDDAFLELLRGMLTVAPAERLDVFEVLQRVRRLQGRELEEELREPARRLAALRARSFAGERTGGDQDLMATGVATGGETAAYAQSSTAAAQLDAFADSSVNAASTQMGASAASGAGGMGGDLLGFDLFQGQTVEQASVAGGEQSAGGSFAKFANFESAAPEPRAQQQQPEEGACVAEAADSWADFDAAFASESATVHTSSVAEVPGAGIADTRQGRSVGVAGNVSATAEPPEAGLSARPPYMGRRSDSRAMRSSQSGQDAEDLLGLQGLYLSKQEHTPAPPLHSTKEIASRQADGAKAVDFADLINFEAS